MLLLNFIIDCMNYRISRCIVVQHNASSTVVEYEDNEIHFLVKKKKSRKQPDIFISQNWKQS